MVTTDSTLPTKTHSNLTNLHTLSQWCRDRGTTPMAGCTE
uniref:Uncharacterized protein n=1 Tax=Anguilla anguilla TaxID=7936 RepID=A0A0E9T9Z1_ANGAN